MRIKMKGFLYCVSFEHAFFRETHLLAKVQMKLAGRSKARKKLIFCRRGSEYPHTRQNLICLAKKKKEYNTLLRIF